MGVHAAVAAAEQFAAGHPTIEQAKSFLGAAEFTLAQRLTPGPESMLHWQKAGAAYEALLAQSPNNPTWQRNVALVDRKALLADRLSISAAIRYSDHQLTNGKELFALAKQQAVFDKLLADDPAKSIYANMNIKVDYSVSANSHGDLILDLQDMTLLDLKITRDNVTRDSKFTDTGKLTASKQITSSMVLYE